MRILVTGASGMVGQGVVRACERAGGVEVVSLTRETLAAPLAGTFDACFFCLGVSSAGMTEEAYTKITYDLTMDVARRLKESSPNATFVYVSGAGTRSDERGGMWARVKGKTENALIAMFGERAYMFRPGLIRPMHGARSKTASYRWAYHAMWPFMPAIVALGGGTTTERVGKAMLAVARHGDAKKLLGNGDINRLAKT